MSSNRSFEQGWQLLHQNIPTPIVKFLNNHGLDINLKLDYVTHPLISGNKWRKLKFNLLKAKEENKTKLITFGGAFSNHLIATASAAREFGFESAGFVRGDELNSFSNGTLKRCHEMGMELKFISRNEYQMKTTNYFLSDLIAQYPEAYIIPEGGTNLLAIKGVEEIAQEVDYMPDFVCCAVGTGGTLVGLSKAFPTSKILGFKVLKADNLESEIQEFLVSNNIENQQNWELIGGYEFGGYGKFNQHILDFISKSDIPFDKVYTAKLMLGVLEESRKRRFSKDANILVYHSGGLQGN